MPIVNCRSDDRQTGRAVRRAVNPPTTRSASDVKAADAIAPALPLTKKNGISGTGAPTQNTSRTRRSPLHGLEPFLRIDPQLLARVRIERDRRVARELGGHLFRETGGQSLRSIDRREFGTLALRVSMELLRFQMEHPLEDLALHLHRDVLPSTHREGAGQQLR